VQVSELCKTCEPSVEDVDLSELFQNMKKGQDIVEMFEKMSISPRYKIEDIKPPTVSTEIKNKKTSESKRKSSESKRTVATVLDKDSVINDKSLHTVENLTKLNKDDLTALCKKHGIKNYSKLNKADLVTYITQQ